MDLIAFTLSGSFAAFRDPSITANQMVYFIPSKSAMIGLLGAILGIKRDHNLGPIYSTEYLDLYQKTNIGIQLCNNPKKITLYTNHVSIKESKTKPFKTELLESPEYVIYVQTSNEIMANLVKAISEKQFVFSPYLGHAYCPARLENPVIYSVKQDVNPLGMKTNCVILDESDFTQSKSGIRVLKEEGENHKIIIERHLHHFFDDKKFERRVLKHWIPVGGSEYSIENYPNEKKYSNFIEVDGKTICLY